MPQSLHKLKLPIHCTAEKMANDFVITGKRPPTASGVRHLTASSKDFGYYTKNTKSITDETLFQSQHTSALNAPVTFAAPWAKTLQRKADKGYTKKTKPGRPLLWAPDTTNTQFSISNSITASSKDCEDDSTKEMSRMPGTIQGNPLKHQYRRLRHTPTFVDETLFGDQLMEPTFKAPWEEKKKVKQILTWYSDQREDRKPVRRRHRPATALGLRGYSSSGNAVPVWKP